MNKPLLAGLLVALALLPCACMGGCAVGAASGDDATPTPTRTVEKVVRTTPPECLEALRQADEGFRVAADGFKAASDMLDATDKQDPAAMRGASDRLNATASRLREVAPRYRAAKVSCRE